MKVIHVVNSLACGGLEQMALQLVRKLNEAGIPSDIVCLAQKGELAAEAEKCGITVKSLEKTCGFDFGLILRLAKVCRELGGDIIHTHNFAPLIYGTLAAKLCGKKCLNTRHGRTDDKTYPFIWHLNDYIVPVSEDTRAHLLKHNSISPDKLKVIYNGVDLALYSAGAGKTEIETTRAQIGVAPQSFVIATVGRLSPEKDHLTLLKAFKKLRKKKMEGDLLIVGDGPLRAKLEQAAVQHEVADRVKFLGFRDDVVKILRASDVFVLSSYREGLSLSVLEAMACSKPVVATKVGGTPEMIIDGETGYLVPCGFPERIEVAVMKLYINRETARQIGENARRKVEETFNLKKMVEGYRALYESMSGQL